MTPLEGTSARTTRAGLAAFCLKNGWRDESTAGLTQLTNFIQDTLEQLTAEFNWPFYRKTHYFNLTVPYTTGTVNLTEAGTTVTGAGTADFASAMAYQMFYTGSDPGRVYQIASVAASAETMVLNSAYLGDSEDGATYACLLYTSPSPRDATLSRMPSSA